MKKHKAFIAYRHTGEKTEYLEELLGAVRDALAKVDVEAYCTFFDEAEFQDKSLEAYQIMEHAFSVIDESDMLFVIQTSENKSEGMLMEVGYCIAKDIPIVVAASSKVKQSYLSEMATASFKWDDLQDLQKLIKQADLSEIL
jgi:nucleoside 2-deoxyribosyltransferase